jgi:hypothetical protein
LEIFLLIGKISENFLGALSTIVMLIQPNTTAVSDAAYNSTRAAFLFFTRPLDKLTKARNSLAFCSNLSALSFDRIIFISLFGTFFLSRSQAVVWTLRIRQSNETLALFTCQGYWLSLPTVEYTQQA